MEKSFAIHGNQGFAFRVVKITDVVKEIES